MMKKIIQATKPKYIFDYVFVTMLFWNFSAFIIFPFIYPVEQENKLLEIIITIMTFHYYFLIPHDAGIGAWVGYITIPTLIAVLINVFALIIKRTTGKITYSSIIASTLVFALLSLTIQFVSINIEQRNDSNLRKESAAIGKKMVMSLVKCDFIQDSYDLKQLECTFSVMDTPPVLSSEPYVEIILRSDKQSFTDSPVANMTVKLSKTTDKVLEGNLRIAKKDFSSIYISSFDFIDGSKRYPSADIKLYLIQ